MCSLGADASDRRLPCRATLLRQLPRDSLFDVPTKCSPNSIVRAPDRLIG